MTDARPAKLHPNECAARRRAARRIGKSLAESPNRFPGYALDSKIERSGHAATAARRLGCRHTGREHQVRGLPRLPKLIDHELQLLDQAWVQTADAGSQLGPAGLAESGQRLLGLRNATGTCEEGNLIDPLWACRSVAL